MYNTGENFLTNIAKYGRQFDTLIYVNDDTEPLTAYDINIFKPNFNASLFQSVMRVLEIDTNVKIEKGSSIHGKLGIKFNEEDDFDYIDYLGYQTIDDAEYDEDTKAYVVDAYDRMVEAMVDYETLDISYPISVRNFLIAMCEKLGWDTSGIPETFVNSDILIYEDPFTNIGYTYRDCFDEFAMITCSFPCFVDDLFTLKYITETGVIIDDSYLNQNNLSFIKEYYVNSVAFSRSEDSDTYYKQDEEDIAENGLHEFQLKDLQLLSGDTRSTFMTEIYRYLRDLKFWIFDIATTGIAIFDIADRFTINSNGNLYSVVLLNSELTAQQGLSENMYTEEPEETETDYTYSTSDEKQDNLTKLQVDKVNQKITAVVEQIGDRSEKSTTITQDLEQLQIAVSEVTDMTREVTGNNTLHISDTVEGSGYVLNFAIFGNTDNMYFVTPEDYLVPSDELVPNRRRANNCM